MNKIIQGDCLDKLKELEDNSVDCCITSPPYWGLRDYGTATWEGGDDGCEHTISSGDTDPKKEGQERVTRGNRSTCVKCGAKRIDSQLGLEKTPEEFVENLVKLFREVKRVLKKEGTLWLNLGDSYAGSGKGRNGDGSMGKLESKLQQGSVGSYQGSVPSTKEIEGLKPKDLVGIPWRVAFALQADGWYLRQDIIWHKPNPMPESVTDRCTKSHEYVFLLSKSKKYYFDNVAIKEPAVQNRWGGKNPMNPKNSKGDVNGLNRERDMMSETRNKRSVWTVTTKPFRAAHFATFPEALIEPMIKAGCPEFVCNKCGKGRESSRKSVGEKLDEEAGVVTDKSKPYAVAERKGYVEVRDLPPIKEIKEYLTLWRKKSGYTIDQVESEMKSQAPHHWFNGESYPTKDDWLEVKRLFKFDSTYDFQMTDITLKPAEKLAGKYKVVLSDCGCNAGFSGGIVLDPFFGAGTTGLVALKLDRQYVGIELNPEYIKIAEDRLKPFESKLF